MSRAALTARYRPRLFSEVAGQETVTTILSRAALEDRVAPAYLFSGTRGVGKTTLARIFAKALNCRNAPAAEPCDACDVCRAVTAGSSVDVVEIDGASNRGIDDVRKLREVVGYAPMEGRYKIFIIDEAHMLSREAFNALLKTLEEPPPRVTFILATTEAHKFPATIVSRCQHYVFKRLPESRLTAHICGILQREGVDYEEGAARLLARRGAGSVRDAMSLLGQVLALGEERLTEASTRQVLGLAGQEAFGAMLAAFRDGDCITLSALLRNMLDQGLDVGFFLRELTALWRNLFILRQGGEAALAAVDLPGDEARAYLAACTDFSLPHLHACWQMTLEGQRRVLSGMEPAPALELLLFNLAMLPRLLSLESLSALGRKGIPATTAALPRPALSSASAPVAPSPVALASVAPAPSPAHEPGVTKIQTAVSPSASVPVASSPVALASVAPAPSPAHEPGVTKIQTALSPSASVPVAPSPVAPASSPAHEAGVAEMQAAPAASAHELSRPDAAVSAASTRGPALSDAGATVPAESSMRELDRFSAGASISAVLPTRDSDLSEASAAPAPAASTPPSFPTQTEAAPQIKTAPQAEAASQGSRTADRPQTVPLLLTPPAGPGERRPARETRPPGTAKKKTRGDTGNKGDKGDKKAVMEHSMVQEVLAHFGDARYVDHGRR
ncbi:MAG: DNA polymerase III subunit gamma/tau [Desulfovibrio sp.]|jgi:DNA polymerase-3 subunit gamma/tau|nr:DNA polymerase III subunit gamma/tau [Desulfovibrio sp.]